MKVRQFEIWLSDLNPQIQSEPGKVRPVLIIQTDLLNEIGHPSTIICPITTQVDSTSEILRVNVNKGIGNLKEKCDIMIDQIRAIDKRRLKSKIGDLPKDLIVKVKANILTVLDLE